MTNPVRSPDSLSYLLQLIREDGVIKVLDSAELYTEKSIRNTVHDEFLILDGELEYHTINGVYSTPFGLIPRVRDVMKIGDLPHQTVLNRVNNPTAKYAEWSRIVNPTQEQLIMAIENVNKLYIEHFSKYDHCEVCNALDNALFKEGCWLIHSTHLCGEDEQAFDDIEFSYSYGGYDYSVNLLDWLKGSSPHLLEIADE